MMMQSAVRRGMPRRLFVCFFSVAAALVFNLAWRLDACQAADAPAGQHDVTPGITTVDKPSTASTNAFYVGNRAPLRPSPLIPLPVGVVKPHGWLYQQIKLQAEGFHGHLGEISRFLKKENNSWLSPQGIGEHGWEEVPYWLKGYSLAAYILGDPKLLGETKLWIEAAIASQQPDGWFGPQAAKSTVSSTAGQYDLWPNMVMLACLQSYYEYSGDRRVLDLMTKYFRFELGIAEKDFLPPYWQQQRGADNLMSVYWLYNRTGEPWLLELAQKIHRHTANWTDGVPNWHNVNMAQAFGGPTTFYMQSGDPKHLDASLRNFQTIRRMYGQVPGGLFGGDENCREGFFGPRQGIETCGIVEMMHSTETLAWITGDLAWADRCEDAAFNTLPAALTADMKALRYLTAPDMPLSDRADKSPGVQNGGPMLLMDPHSHRCCQHNWGHGWPYYAVQLWFATPDNGLAAVFYSECELTAQVGDGSRVTIQEKTHYPFDENVDLVVRFADGTAKATPTVRFPLYLRVPGWCEKPAVTVAGQPCEVSARPDSFLRIDREWKDGDTVRLTLPMQIAVRTWQANADSVSIDRGPLTYSLKIGEKYVRAGGTDAWPAWEIYPTTPWNYGLILDKARPGDSFEVVRRSWPASDMPFTLEGAPIELVGRGKRIPEWQLDEQGLVANPQASPVASDEPVERITLIPMGAARLRIASFPVIGDGRDAHRWTAPPKPLPYRPSASHCWGSDTVKAICDRREPKSSGDQSTPRLTWWDHRGTAEWVQYDFPAPRKVSGVEVYWFDDTGRGQCRLPQSWKVLYRDGDRWAPVENAAKYGVEKDKFNRADFPPVETTGLRLEVNLQADFSGGILEWRVLPGETP